jgi:hypothetical protein
MDYTIEEVRKYIEEEDVKFIRLAFRDAYGVQKNISVMPGELMKAYEDGAPINARAIALPCLSHFCTERHKRQFCQLEHLMTEWDANDSYAQQTAEEKVAERKL